MILLVRTALHLGGATSSDSTLRETYFHASQERYHRKHFGALGWQVTRAAVVVGSGGDLEEWMDGLGLDAVIFPAVADVGPADADVS